MELLQNKTKVFLTKNLPARSSRTHMAKSVGSNNTLRGAGSGVEAGELLPDLGLPGTNWQAQT